MNRIPPFVARTRAAVRRRRPRWTLVWGYRPLPA